MNNETMNNGVVAAPRVADTQVAEWEAEFEAARRRPLAVRMRYSFIRTYKPVLDDAPYRSFETMAEYREWCEKNLPGWLGYGRSL
jgi:hypothetical protein